MATMCENCFEVDTRKYKPKRTCKRCGGLLVQIDEMLLPTISLLNKKGYRTAFCCSGHTYDLLSNPYMFFETYICFENHVKLPNLPEGFNYTGDFYGGRFSISKNIFDDWTDTYRQAEVLKNNLKLLEWATELPQHNESNIL